MCDNGEFSVDELENIGNILVDSVEDLESLEIFIKQESGPIHLAYKTDKSGNIRDFLKFTSYAEGDEFKDANKCNVMCKDIHFSFNRVQEFCQDYAVFILVSKENVG